MEITSITITNDQFEMSVITTSIQSHMNAVNALIEEVHMIDRAEWSRLVDARRGLNRAVRQLQNKHQELALSFYEDDKEVK